MVETAVLLAVFAAGFLLGRCTKPLAMLLVLATEVGAAGPAGAVLAAHADFVKLDADTQFYTRYMWDPKPQYTTPEVVGAAAGVAAELFDLNPILKYHVNQLSIKGAFGDPARVGYTVWRIDVRDYGWSVDTWEKLARDNYYFVESIDKLVVKVVKGKRVKKLVTERYPASWLPTKEYGELLASTESFTPIVSAPWFIANTSRSLNLRNQKRGYGYYDWFGVKKPQDFLDLLKIKLDDSIEVERDILEVVDESEISEQNRAIELHDQLVGLVAFTRDVKDETGKGNAIRRLRREDLKADAREWYFPLWNRLPGTMLSDDALKELQDSAPDFIGYDHSRLNTSKDGRIHVCIGCMRCHAGNVLQPVKGWARLNFRVDKLALNVPLYEYLSKQKQYEIYKTLERQYIRLNFANRLNEQRLIYRTAIQDVAGMDAGTLARRFAKVYHRYKNEPVTLEVAALEWGSTPKEVITAFTEYGGLEAARRKTGPGGIAPELGALINGQPMKRLKFEDNYADGANILRLYKGAKP